MTPVTDNCIQSCAPSNLRNSDGSKAHEIVKLEAMLFDAPTRHYCRSPFDFNTSDATTRGVVGIVFTITVEPTYIAFALFTHRCNLTNKPDGHSSAGALRSTLTFQGDAITSNKRVKAKVGDTKDCFLDHGLATFSYTKRQAAVGVSPIPAPVLISISRLSAAALTRVTATLLTLSATNNTVKRKNDCSNDSNNNANSYNAKKVKAAFKAVSTVTIDASSSASTSSALSRPNPTRVTIKAYMKRHNQYRVLVCRDACDQDEEEWMAMKDMDDFSELGVLIEWTIGCNLSTKFPIHPPTDKPWIAFISSSLLYNNTKSHTNNDDNDYSYDEDACDVTTLIAIVQAISEEVTGVIMYQDSKSKITYEELRQQTEVAIRDLAGLLPGIDQEGNGVMVASPLTSGVVTKRASPAQAGGVTKEQLLAKLAVIKRQRARKAFNKNQPTSTAKLATLGESPYILDVQPPTDPTPTVDSGINNEGPQPSSEALPSAPTPAPAAVSSIGVLAMGDPALIKILQDSTKITGESVIAQLKFANNAIGPHQLPSNPISPPTPTAGAERPAADRSLGLFFWIILGSVVLIVGVWVGFGVVEARSLARRRQQIALDSVKRRTVDQKVLDTYKIRVFKEDDITYSDDDDDDNNDKGGMTSNTQPRQKEGQDQDLEKGGEGPNAAPKDIVYDDKDLYRGAEQQQAKAQRVYARADLAALRLVATDRGSYAGSTINSPALGRRSGSFDETVYGGLDSARLRRGSMPGSIFWERRPSVNATLALSRDERCRSWAESGADMFDYGGESESEYGYDQEQGYKSHAQQGWADLQVETIKGLDAVKCKEVKAATIVVPTAGVTAETGKVEMLEVVAPALRRGSVPSLNVTPVATPSRETFADTALPTFPAASARRGSGVTLLAQQPALKHKSRFILPRKIETNKLPTVSVVHSGEVTSPTIYGCGNGEGSINSACPSTAGFLPPAGWGGERRRSSQATVAVPDNGRGVAQPNWIGPRGQRLRRSSLQVQRMGSPPLASASESEDELESESESGQSDLDDGRGVGTVGRAATAAVSQGLRRTSQQVHRISFEKLSSITPPPPLMEVAPSSKTTSGRDKSRKHEEVISPMSDHKMRFSVIGIDLPDIYSPTKGEFSRLSLDADRFMLPYIGTKHSRSRSARQKASESDREQQVEQLQDSDSSSFGSRRSSRSQRSSAASTSSGYRRHGKELTTNTMATSISASTTDTSTSTSTRPSKGAASGKQRKRRYDPCAICIEEYEVGDQLRELPCKHFFHSHCIDPYFKDYHGICPVCKRDYSEAGTMSPNARRQASRASLRVEQPSGVASFLAPLAMFATGASGVHYWYAAEASMHMM
ncbi:hypothetical protein EC957_000550 [Mortierella hygrophila]|uniref:RING-type domain-containing protein n=1 Tax=Mortierella hygrophila TaxID=979708 RepID=A0A9P6F7G9_9FUNG|nr:hypothetical protein EC957_000550 [Mortierella hygrophila]